MTEKMQQDTAETARGALPCHEATDLTDGGSVAHIRLSDQTYTLRITRAGKLILTK